jgi:hypothetical protein
MTLHDTRLLCGPIYLPNCIRLLQYLKKKRKPITEKNTDISIFFRNCTLQNLLFSNDAKQSKQLRYNNLDSLAFSQGPEIGRPILV